jgi:hypothetical protein
MAKKFDFLSPGILIREIDQSIIPPERDEEGPIIIGRARKGPGNKPVKIKNLDDFISIFGKPVAGGGEGGDIWREGNTVGPTFGAYAAQAWLASGEAPITYVRLVGDQHPGASAAGYAGWQLGSNGITTSTSTNSTAYGLFIADNTTDLGQGLAFATLTVQGGLPSNNDTVTITEQDGTALIFELDSDDTVAAGRVEVNIAGGANATALNLANAIQGEIEKGNLVNFVVQYNATIAPAVVNIAFTGTTLGSAAVASSNGSGIALAGETLAPAAQAIGEGALAAIFYADSGHLKLGGEEYGSTAGSTFQFGAGRLIQSIGQDKHFGLQVFNASGVEVDRVDFNFNRNSSRYIRNVFNTNPQLVNSQITPSDDLKSYWLGETFTRHLETYVTGTVQRGQSAVLLPLGSATAGTANWGYRATGSAPAKTGYVFSQRATNQQQLFRFCGLSDGEDFQKNHMISIEEIREPANPVVNPYGTFAVCVKDLAGNSIEKFSNLDLNPASTNYIARRIGDQYMSWDNSKRRYRTYGDFLNLSNYIRVEVASGIANGGAAGVLPAGFRGPVKHKSIAATSGSSVIHSVVSGGIGGDFTAAFVQPGNSSTVVGGHGGSYAVAAHGDQDFVVKYHFPSIPLRKSGSDGGAADPYRVHWGIRPKLSDTSNQHDPDYVDYLRFLPAGIDSHTPNSDAFEYSYNFSLDDLVINSASGSAIYRSGSYHATNNTTANSFTSPGNNQLNANGTFGDLLDLGVRQFIMPIFGGREGLNIKEAEPFRNIDVIGTTLSETTNYTHYSINKAIDSIRDPEVVAGNLLLMPGIYQPIMTDKLINTAETRQDVLAIIDLESDYTQSTENTDNSTQRLGSVTTAISSLKSRNLNSSFACSFYPAVQAVDNLSPGAPYVWLPASVAGLGAMASSQQRTDVWFAPAGFNRGGLGNLGGRRGPRVIQARQRLDSRERDDLYQVNINPIATFPAEGVVVFGQKTLQADQSALDRINVRRLLLFLKSRVSTVSRGLLFDPNVQTTWNRFKGSVEPVLSDVKARFGLTDYRIILDETTTTADLIDRNVMYAKIFIKPARAIEFIVVDFVITRTGADFT